MMDSVFERLNTHQIVIGFDAEQLSEVAKGQRGVCFQSEIWVVMCRSQVAALTREQTKRIKFLCAKVNIQKHNNSCLLHATGIFKGLYI